MYININLVTPPPTNIRRLAIVNIVGTNFLETRQAKILFNCKERETVYDCLSARIDHFDLNLKIK